MPPNWVKYKNNPSKHDGVNNTAKTKVGTDGIKTDWKCVFLKT